MSDATSRPPLRFGTRGSALALAQTALVMDRLRARYPDLPMERVIIRTAGDADQTTPLTVIGGSGVFTSALQVALVRGEIDVAVHSAKDVPSETPTELSLVAFLARDDARDVFVSRHGVPLTRLPPRPVIGTSSRRRSTQVLAIRPDATIVPLRGNIDTRLRKSEASDLDGIVLAAAGVARMGWDDRVTEYLPLDRMVPSPGQGALAVEIRAGDDGPAASLAALDEPAVSAAVRVERAFLRAIGAGCTTPLGAYAELVAGRVRLRAMLASDDGDRVERADVDLDPGTAETGAATLARRMALAVGIGQAAEAPLVGLRVLVTRPREQACELSRALRVAGAEPIESPAIRIAEAADPAALDAALHGLATARYDWVVFTSANAAERVLTRLGGFDDGVDILRRARIAAIGPATAATLRADGVGVDLMPEQFVAEAVAGALAAQGVTGQRILIPRADRARDDLPRALRAAGAVVETVTAYRTVPASEVNPVLRARFVRGEIEVVTFSSGSAVQGLLAMLGGDRSLVNRALVACLGPVTAQVARDAGVRVDLVAETSTISGLVEALIAYQHQRQVASVGAAQSWPAGDNEGSKA